MFINTFFKLLLEYPFPVISPKYFVFLLVRINITLCIPTNKSNELIIVENFSWGCTYYLNIHALENMNQIVKCELRINLGDEIKS